MGRSGHPGATPSFHGARRRFVPLPVGVLGLAVLLLVAATPIASAPAFDERDLLLRVGGQDQMKTRNPLPAAANDVWTSDVLDRVYEAPIKADPNGRILPYIAKGVDADEDGQFEPTEYGAFQEAGTVSPLEIVVYYDFNGVRWHDGVQMTAWDLLFSYHVNAMNPRFSTFLRGIYCSSGPGASYESCGRQLNVDVLPTKQWTGEGTLPGNDALRVAVLFRLVQPYVYFYEYTLAPRLLPMHVWSRTGGGRHADFGCAIWVPPSEAASKGIAECAHADPARWGKGIAASEPVTGSSPFLYPSADAWTPTDADVIGSGPFRFETWVFGVTTRLRRYDDYSAGIAYDPWLARLLHRPYITGIEFKVYKTTQLGVFALLSGEIDFYHWNVGAEFVPDFIWNPDIGIEANAEPGYFYMGYNFRREPWGYRWTNGTREDVGLVLRQAIAHLIDKKSIVQNLMQNFGVVAHGVVSPANTFWYNDNIPKPGYDLEAARALLDSPEARAVGIGPDPPGPCYRDAPEGCRDIGARGTAVFEVYTPTADYDRIRAAAGAMGTDAMRQVGLNADAKPIAFGILVDRINQRDFDLFILGWRIAGSDDPTGYLYSFFGCFPGNVPVPNLIGYCNPDLDAVLLDASQEMDRDRRQALVFRAQEILAEDRPVEPLYYRTNIEAYRQDRFVNWTVAGGTIWNEWSLLGIRPPIEGSLHVGIDAATAVGAGDREGILVNVRDGHGEPVVGAAVVLSVSAANGEDPGSLITGDVEGSELALTTDSLGRVRVTYAAPTLYESTRPVVLRAVVTHPGYADPATEETVVTVMGRNLGFLRVRIDLPLGDVAYPGASVPVSLDVLEVDLRWVGDASVQLIASPAGTVTPSNGTAADLRVATAEFPEVGVYTVSASVTKEGYHAAWAYATVWVLEPPEPPPGPEPYEPEESVSLELVLAVVGGVLGAMTLAASLWSWGRRRRRRARD